MMRTNIMLAGIICGLTGCAHAATASEAARVVACQAVEERIENRHADGHISREQAGMRISCVRTVCDELHRRLADE